MSRNPHYPGWYASALALAQFLQQDYQGTVDTLNAIGSPAIWDHRYMAAALGQLDKKAEAAMNLAAVLEANPDFSVEAFGSTLKFRKSADKDLFIEGLLKAGFPR